VLSVRARWPRPWRIAASRSWSGAGKAGGRCLGWSATLLRSGQGNSD
jgi:hypothetical protein